MAIQPVLCEEGADVHHLLGRYNVVVQVDVGGVAVIVRTVQVASLLAHAARFFDFATTSRSKRSIWNLSLKSRLPSQLLPNSSALPIG